MAVYLLWQWVGIITLAFIGVTIGCIIKCIGNWLQKRRDRRYYENLYGNYSIYGDAPHGGEYQNDILYGDMPLNVARNTQLRDSLYNPPNIPFDNEPIPLPYQSSVLEGKFDTFT